MGRIKQGLDYFPLSTDFMHDRIVRRVMNLYYVLSLFGRGLLCPCRHRFL